jgi:hypothetical protein
MIDSEFETTLDRLYERAPPLVDEAAFVTKLEKRRSAEVLYRILVLGLLGSIGGLVTAVWLIGSGLLSCCHFAGVLSFLLETASRNWVLLALLLLWLGHSGQRNLGSV